MSTQILMPALSPTTSCVMARLVRAIQLPRVGAANESFAHLGGPQSRAMTPRGFMQ